MMHSFFSARSAEVRNSRLAYALIATLCMLLGVANFATAQGQNPPSGTNVALIDINKVFEKHGEFQERFKALGERFKGLEKSAKTEQTKILRMKDDLEKFNPGTPQYKEKEAELAKSDSELRVQLTLEQKALAEEEAKIYYETYKQVEEVTADFAARYRIGLVLRHSGSEMKPEDPNSVRMGLMKMVIYQKGLDITDQIIKEINRDTPTKSSAPVSTKGGEGTGPKIAGKEKATKTK